MNLFISCSGLAWSWRANSDGLFDQGYTCLFNAYHVTECVGLCPPTPRQWESVGAWDASSVRRNPNTTSPCLCETWTLSAEIPTGVLRSGMSHTTFRPPQLRLETSALQCNFSNRPTYICISYFFMKHKKGFEEIHPNVLLAAPFCRGHYMQRANFTHTKQMYLLFYTGRPSWCNLGSNLQLQTTVLTVELPWPQVLA